MSQRILSIQGRLPLALLNQGWGTLAFSCLQHGLEHYGDLERCFLAYQTVAGWTVVLGPPVGPTDEGIQLLRKFIRSRRQPGRVAFVQIREEFLPCLRDFGYRVVPFGTEAEVSLDKFNLRGRKLHALRSARNSAARAKITVIEEQDSKALRADLAHLSTQWRKQKAVSSCEIRFLSRPFVDYPERDVRFFTAWQDNRRIAFVSFDPLYREGKVTGYTAMNLRALPQVQRCGNSRNVVDAIILEAIDQLKKEGLEQLCLGIQPLHRLEELEREFGTDCPIVSFFLKRLYRWGSTLYPFRGRSYHTSLYRGHERPVFAAFPGFGLGPTVRLMKLCGILR